MRSKFLILALVSGSVYAQHVVVNDGATSITDTKPVIVGTDCVECPPEIDYANPTPQVISQGIEVPYVVYLDATNRAIGIAQEMIEVESNVYAEIVYKFHGSPIVWDTVESNRNAAITSKKAEHAARKAIATDAKTTKENAAANRNKPATMADIERLAEMIERLNQ